MKKGKGLAAKRKTAAKKKEERVSSGVIGMDKLVDGGFEKNSVNLIVGGTGSGKTIFAMQFLMDGIEKGENVLYITFEEKRAEFFRDMLNFGWDLKEYEKEKRFFFLEYNPEKVRVMLEEGGGSAESIVIQNKINRIVIDSVSSFAMLFNEELEKREAALSLFGMIRKWNCTSLLTLQEDPEDRKEGSSTSLEFEADGIILLYFVRYKNERQRFIEILKMRGTKHSTKIYSLAITKKGFVIGNKIMNGHFES